MYKEHSEVNPRVSGERYQSHTFIQ